LTSKLPSANIHTNSQSGRSFHGFLQKRYSVGYLSSITSSRVSRPHTGGTGVCGKDQPRLETDTKAQDFAANAYLFHYFPLLSQWFMK
jgi:hypothetical protein